MPSPLRSSLALALLALAGCDDDTATPIDAALDATHTDMASADMAFDMASADMASVDMTPDDSALPDMAPPDASACTYTADDTTPPPEPRRHTPRWAFEPWISKDISDREDTYAFVNGFRDRDIPVGVVVLDSPWETHYNTFIPNPDRYPDFEGMVADLRADGVRTVLWITQMVNTVSFDFEVGGDTYPGRSPNFDEGDACGFFIEDGRTFTWWKGRGAGVDFFDPLAMRWWHDQQDRVLDAGIAGWKLDFGESYIRLDTVDTAIGPVPHQQYSEAYYRDFLAYGAEQRGVEEFVTMVRPYDVSYDHEARFYARPEHAPVAWVGDNSRDYGGLIDALDHLFRSADAGYVVIGSDIGGYLDFVDVGAIPGPGLDFDWQTFIDWTALGAMTPFMQLHGRANLTPWNVPQEDGDTVGIYRRWSWLHTALIPFWYSLAEAAYRDGAPPIMRPIGPDLAAWTDDWRYMLGEAFLVAPLFAPGGERDVPLPPDARWYDWWAPAADPYDGGQTLRDTHGADQSGRIPLYVREGALIPLDVQNDVNGLGTADSAGHLTVLAWPAADPSAFTLYDQDDAPTQITARLDGAAHLGFDRLLRPTLARIRWTDPDPVTVTVGDAPAAPRADFTALATAPDPGWWRDAATGSIWVKLPAGPGLTASIDRQ